MTVELPVYISKAPISQQDLIRLDHYDLATNWQGKQTSWGVTFAFGADPERIHFTVRLPVGQKAALKCFPTAEVCEFVEGLWENDVAEFFIKSDSSCSYQEFNLAPDGKWWSALFSGYRKREDKDCCMKGVETFSQNEQKSVFFGISIPRAELKIDIAFGSSSRMYVTAIVNTPDREFLIWSPPPTPEPDFHLMQYAPAVAPLSI